MWGSGVGGLFCGRNGAEAHQQSPPPTPGCPENKGEKQSITWPRPPRVHIVHGAANTAAENVAQTRGSSGIEESQAMSVTPPGGGARVCGLGGRGGCRAGRGVGWGSGGAAEDHSATFPITGNQLWRSGRNLGVDCGRFFFLPAPCKIGEFGGGGGGGDVQRGAKTRRGINGRGFVLTRR